MGKNESLLPHLSVLGNQECVPIFRDESIGSLSHSEPQHDLYPPPKASFGYIR